jgi:tetratricopeptide (TPR) repeat protein
LKKIISIFISLFVFASVIFNLVGCSVKPKDAGKIPITTSSDEARQNFIKGRDLVEKQLGQESLQYFNKAIEADSTFALAYLTRASLQSTAKDFNSDLHKAVSFAGNTSQGEQLMISGFEAGINENTVKQKEYFEKLVSLYPKDERAHNLLANYYSGQSLDQKAIDELNKAAEISPDYSPTYNTLGYAYKKVENYAEAEKAFQKYTELVPNDPNPYDSYAELLLKEGKYDASIENYQKALTHNSGFVSSKVGIAAAYMYKGNYEEARKELQQFYDSARNNLEKRTALFNMAISYVDDGKLDLALKELEKEYVITEKENDYGNMVDDFDAMGDVLYVNGKYKEALEKYQQGLEASFKSSSSQALKDYVKLGFLYYEGAIAMKQNDFKTASEKADQYMNGAKAINNSEMIKGAHGLMGLIALEQKKADDCLAQLSQTDQQHPGILYFSAKAYELKGDKQKAKELCNKVINFNALPSFSTAFSRFRAKNMLKGI